MLKNTSVKGRMIYIMIAMSVLFVIMISFTIHTAGQIEELGLKSVSEVMLDDQKNKIKSMVDSIVIIAEESIKDTVNEEEKQMILRKLFDRVRFESDQSGYFFIYSGTKVVTIPINKALQGTDMADSKDKNNVYFVRDIASAAKNGGGFVNYVWPKPGSGDTPKLSYSRMISGTDMLIGTGVYIDNIDEYHAKLKAIMEKSVHQSLTWMLLQPFPTSVLTSTPKKAKKLRFIILQDCQSPTLLKELKNPISKLRS